MPHCLKAIWGGVPAEAALEGGHGLLAEEVGERGGESGEPHGEAGGERGLREVEGDGGLAEAAAALEEHVLAAVDERRRPSAWGSRTAIRDPASFRRPRGGPIYGGRVAAATFRPFDLKRQNATGSGGR